jgi:chorismate dehydratase
MVMDLGPQGGGAAVAEAPSGELWRSTRRRPVRLGAVRYLNALPLVHGLSGAEGFEIARWAPSRVADALHAGDLDVGMIPSIEYARGGYAIVPGVAIASRGRVGSVCLLHKGPRQGIRRVALDASSRTSAALLKVLLAEESRHDVEYLTLEPDLDAMLDVADAALLIGDLALDLDCPLDRLDLGEEWTTRTGLPFVYAFWAGRPGALSPADVARLLAAQSAGLDDLPGIARSFALAGAGRAERQPRYLAYLRDNIVYALGEAEQRGLREFYRRATRIGILGAPPELRFHAAS